MAAPKPVIAPGTAKTEALAAAKAPNPTKARASIPAEAKLPIPAAAKPVIALPEYIRVLKHHPLFGKYERLLYIADNALQVLALTLTLSLTLPPTPTPTLTPNP